MDPITIIAAISAGEKLVEYVGGVIARHKAGQQATADEAAKLLAAAGALTGARAENDASDAAMDAEVNRMSGEGPAKA